MAGAVNRSVELCPAVITVGWKAAVTPLGSPVTARVADWLKPFVLWRATT